jgi:hypothetical protein
MKYSALLLLFSICFLNASAQRTVKLRNLWSRPQVHVVFHGYTLSFTLKDIDKTLALLTETGDSLYGTTSGLDTAGNYVVEVFSGTKTQYKNPVQPLMQNGVGVFLLLAGHAYIQNPRHRKVTEIVANIQPTPQSGEAFIMFYDPKNKELLFSGKMNGELYNKDLGIEIE